MVVKEIWVAILLFWVMSARLDSLVQENSLANAFWFFTNNLLVCSFLGNSSVVINIG